MNSPDVDEILWAISVIKGEASVVPEDIDCAVSHAISNLGPEAIKECAHKSAAEKRKFLINHAKDINFKKHNQ